MRIETGLGVLHLFLKPSPHRPLDREAVAAAVKGAEAAEAQVVTAAMLGHKCDVAVMALHREWSVLKALQRDLQAAGLDVVDDVGVMVRLAELRSEQVLRQGLSFRRCEPDREPGAERCHRLRAADAVELVGATMISSYSMRLAR